MFYTLHVVEPLRYDSVLIKKRMNDGRTDRNVCIIIGLSRVSVLTRDKNWKTALFSTRKYKRSVECGGDFCARTGELAGTILKPSVRSVQRIVDVLTRPKIVHQCHGVLPRVPVSCCRRHICERDEDIGNGRHQSFTVLDGRR